MESSTGSGAAHACLLPFAQPTHPSAEDWDMFKGLIVQLYRDENKSLSDVRSFLLYHFNFSATPRMYKRRFTEWAVYKVVRRPDVAALSEQIAGYRAANENSPPLLKHNGRFVQFNRVKRSLRRHSVRKQKRDSILNTSTPTDDSYNNSFSTQASSDVQTLVSAQKFSQDSSELKPGSAGILESASEDSASEGTALGRSSLSATGNHHDLMVEVLTTLRVAMLQTDAHFQDLYMKRCYKSKTDSSHTSPTWLAVKEAVNSNMWI